MSYGILNEARLVKRPPRAGLPVMEPGPDAVALLIGRATAHGDEHVIKFADTRGGRLRTHGRRRHARRGTAGG